MFVVYYIPVFDGAVTGAVFFFFFFFFFFFSNSLLVQMKFDCRETNNHH
jgi:hypothetical protein